MVLRPNSASCRVTHHCILFRCMRKEKSIFWWFSLSLDNAARFRKLRSVNELTLSTFGMKLMPAADRSAGWLGTT